MRFHPGFALPGLALLALALPASAQDGAPALPRRAPSSFSLAQAIGLKPGDGELVAALLRPDVPSVRREDLEGPGAGAARYHDLPGGIVLGLPARLPDPLAGARLEIDGAGRLALATFCAGRVELPPLAPDLLLPCLEFARSARDSHAAVSMIGDVVRIAPELRTGRIGRLLERADRAPHAHLPAARGTKTMIVDRDARIDVTGRRAAPRADLEVRFYAPADSPFAAGATRRLGTLVLVHGPQGLRPRGASAAADVRALADELEVVAELAGWIGLFRRLASEDPARLEPLERLARERAGLAR